MATNQYPLINDRQWKCLHPGESKEEKHPITLHAWGYTDKTIVLENINFLLQKEKKKV